MSNYNILPYSYMMAKKLNVMIKVSKNPKKKIDVFKNGVKVASIGASGHGDYPHYLLTNKDLAENKRKNYKLRHEKDRHKIGSPGYYADKLLW